MIPQLTKPEQTALIASLAPERFRRFRAAAGGDRQAAKLYILDSQVASHLHAIVRILEVAFRERLHRHLSSAFDEKWYLSQKHNFDVDLNEKVDDVLEQLGRGAPAGKVVAQLMFGTWVALLTKGSKRPDGSNARYVENFWDPALKAAFSNTGLTRKELVRSAQSINWARNRISHCEPVVFGLPQPGLGGPDVQVRKSPGLVLEDMRKFASYLDVEIENWLRRWEEIEQLLNDPLLEVALEYAEKFPRVVLQR